MPKLNKNEWDTLKIAVVIAEKNGVGGDARNILESIKPIPPIKSSSCCHTCQFIYESTYESALEDYLEEKMCKVISEEETEHTPECIAAYYRDGGQSGCIWGKD